jgi:hypothetical protein
MTPTLPDKLRRLADLKERAKRIPDAYMLTPKECRLAADTLDAQEKELARQRTAIKAEYERISGLLAERVALQSRVLALESLLSEAQQHLSVIDHLEYDLKRRIDAALTSTLADGTNERR